MLRIFLLVLVVALLGSRELARAEQLNEARPVGEELVLFTAGNPELWSVKTTGFQGGSAKLTAERAELEVAITKPNAGGGVLARTRFDPSLYLNDPCATVEIVFRTETGNAPRALQASLRTRDRKNLQSRGVITTQWRSVSEAAGRPDGTRILRLPLEPAAEVTANDEVLDVLISGRESGQLVIQRIAIQKLRNVALQVTNPTATYMNRLEIHGQTLEPQADVFIKLADGAGKVHQQRAKSIQGKFALTWETPPITEGKNNVITAKVGSGKETLDNMVPLQVFGYMQNTDHVWLRVKGKQIVTSPLSAGGEKPFIPVGVGYARDVIIPAQDEQVAAFCKAQHLNTIRLPFYTRFFNNGSDRPIDIDHHIKTFIDPVIAAAKRHGLYVILDDHGYFSEKIDEAKARQQQSVNRWDENGVSEWVSRWGRVADYYKNEPYVLGYELCNEPHDIDAQTVREWYARGLAAVRKVDKRHIVLVGTNDWSHSRALEKTWGSVASNFDAPYNNVVYAFHDYPTDNHPWMVQDYITQFRDAHNVPVMCTEFGATWWGHDETTCREFQVGMLALFARENVGWTIWALGQTTNNPRNATPLPDKVRKEKNIPLLPKSEYDSCAYSDIWGPVARIMGSPFPLPQNK